MAIPHLSQVSISTPAGTPPLVVTSSDLVSNLNAQYLNGQLGSYYQNAGNLNAGTLLAARLPAFTGDVSSTVGTVGLTLANSGATAGTYTKVTVNAKGLVTSGAALASADLPTYTGTITGSQVTTGLGFTPYNATNPNVYITASALTGYLPLTGGTMTGELTIATGVNSGVRVNSPSGTQGFWLRVGYDSDGTATPAVSLLNTTLQSSGSSSGTFSFVCGNLKALSISTAAVNSLVALQQAGNQVLHAGNYTSYPDATKLPLAGGTLTGDLTISGASRVFVGSYMNITSSAGYPGMIGLNRNVTTGAIFNASHGAYQIQNQAGLFEIQTYTGAGGYVGAHTFNNSGNVAFITGTVTAGGNQVLHAGNYGAYSAFSGAVSGASLSISGVSSLNRINLNSATNAYIQYRAPGQGTVNANFPFYLNSAFGSINIEVADNDTGGLMIDNEGVTVYGAGDGTSVFRVIDEDVYQATTNITSSRTFWINEGQNGGGGILGAFTISGNIAIHAGNYTSYGDATKLLLAGGTLTGALNGTTAAFSGAITQGGNQVLHAGNYNSYALPLSGGTLASTNDGILTLNKSSGSSWNYINFSHAGTRRFYFGLNGSFEPELGVDNGGTFRVLGGMTVGGNAVLTSASTSAPNLSVGGSSGSCTGNAATATARNINGTSFNHSADITTASWGTGRTITIGSTGKSVDGSAAVAWTLAEIAPGANINYAAADGWTAGTGNGVGYYGGDFGVNGSNSENTRSYKDTPYASAGLVWATTNNDATSNDDGGWNKGISGLNANKAYRSIVWVRRSSSSTNGNFYHGCSGSTTLNLSNAVDSNPYFISFGIGTFTQSVWYLSVGYIHANNDGSTTQYGGLYDATTGQKVVGYADFKMAVSATTQTHRVYLYYSTDPAALLDFWGPRFEEVNGNEPSIGALLGFLPSPRFTGTPTVNGSAILHAGNYTSYPDATKLPLTGGTISGVVRINAQLQVGQNSNGTAYIDAYGGYAWFGRDSNSAGIRIDGSANVHMTNTLNVVGAITQNGNQVLHAANFSSYALPYTGGTLTGTITATNHIGPGTGLTGTATSLNIGGTAATATNVAWSGITSKPTTLAGFGITDAAAINGASNQNFSAYAFYQYDWLRIMADSGIYWQSGTYAGWHIHPQAAWGMSFRSASTDCGLQLRRSDATLLGSVYSDGTSIGFLNASSGWGASFTIAGAMNRGSVPGSLVTGNISGNAATATNGFSFKPNWALEANLIADLSNFNNSVPSGFYQYSSATNSPGTSWYNLINVRHSNTGNDHGFQLAMSYYADVLWSRSYQGGTGVNNGTFTTWRAHLHSGNFNSYALPLTGGTLSGVLTLVSSGTAINISGQSDSFGYNATAGQGTYIKGTGATYIYGGGTFFDGTAVRTLLNSSNYTSYPDATKLPLAGGTLTGALLVNNDNGVRASYDNGGSYAWLYGYGIEFGRATSYIRPNTNRVANLWVGNASINSLDWANIDFYSSGRFNVNNNAILHAGNVSTYAFAKSGAWAADLVSSYGYTRETGMQMTGGSEFVVLSKSGQGYLLVDGSYIAAEAGGFYSTNNSSGATLLGFTADTTASLNFNTAAVKLNGNQVLHAGNFSAYALPYTGGTLTGALNGTTASFSGNVRVSTISAANHGLTCIYYGGGSTPTNGYLITTNIDYGTFNMPTVIIEGYAYGNGVPIHLEIVWYAYNNSWTNLSYTNLGTWNPGTVSIGTNASGKVCLHLSSLIYYGRFNVRCIYDGGNAALEGWTVSDATTAALTRVTTISKVELATSITGNAATVTNGLTTGGGTLTGALNGTSASFSSVVDATQFRDSNDVAYYLDPAGTSNLNQWSIATAARLGRSRNWTNRLAYTGDTGYHTGTNGWGADEGTWANAWKGGFSGWDIWGTSTDHPQGAGYIHAQGIVSGQHYTTTNGSAAYGWMMVGATNATANRYWLRGKWDTSISGWVEMLTSGNASYALAMNQNVGSGNSPSFTGLSVINTITGAVSGSSGSCTGNAASANYATYLNSANYIERISGSGNYNTDFQNTPAGTVRHQGDHANATNNPGATWWFVDNYRHSNGSNYWGVQVAWGWEDNANKLATRNVTGGAFGNWVYYLNSANYTSYVLATSGTAASLSIGGSSGSCTGNAASASSVAWTNVSGRPTALSSFSNDSGYITSGSSISGSSGSCTGNAASVTDGVYLSTNQYISGVKTFSSAPVATNIAKAWVHYNMYNNTINASYNVSSVTDNGAGVCTVNFSTAMVDANYVVAGTATYDYDNQDIHTMVLAVPRRSTAQQAGSCRLATEYMHAAAVYDSVAVRAVFYR